MTKKPLQISAQSHFSNDLGLDSLDTVEVVMAIEEVELPRDQAKVFVDISSRNSVLRYQTRKPMPFIAVSARPGAESIYHD